MNDAEQIAWNRQRHSEADIRRIQTALGLEPDGNWGPETQHAAEVWQLEHGLVVDGQVGAKTLAAMLEHDGTPTEQVWVELTDDEIDRVMALTVEVESAGKSNPYAAANQDAEYEGWFDKPKRDEAGRTLHPRDRAKHSDHDPHDCSKYGPTPSHVGLSHGPIQTTQDGGGLGKVMAYWLNDEPRIIDAHFRGRSAEIVDVLTAPGPSGASRNVLRGPRVKPVDGHDLWEPYWMPSWNAAAKEPGYQRAQRRVMREEYMDAAIAACKAHGHSSQAHLAIAFDCAVQYGRGGMRKRFERAGDFATVPQLLDVIEELGDQRARLRRAEIASHCDVGVYYDDLVFVGPTR